MRVCIYWRYSKDEQSVYSDAAQIRACQDYAAARGWTVVATYGDPGRSGRRIRSRPEFQKMLADAQAGRFDVALVHKLDRFSRNLVDIFTTLTELEARNICLVSVTESAFDFTTPQGRLFLGMLALFAQWYVENLSQETRKGKLERARQGGWNGALPFGYTTPGIIKKRIERKAPHADELQVYLDGLTRYRDTDAVFDPFEIDGYRMAVELYETGQYGDVDIANALNSKGYRTSGHWGARPFSKDTVSPMMRNRFYSGQVQYRGEWMPGRHEAAVTPERWERLQAIRVQRSNRPQTTKRTDRVYPLRKVARCVECQSLLRGHAAKGKRYYRDPAHDYGVTCRQQTTFEAVPIEEQLGEFLGGFALPAGWQEQVLALVQASVGDTDPDRAERQRLEGQLERAKQLFILGDLDDKAYQAESVRIRQAMARLRLPCDPAIDLKRAAHLLDDIPALWQQANDQERARLVSTVFENIWIENKQIIGIEPKPAFYEVMMVCQRNGQDQGDASDGGSMSEAKGKPVAPANGKHKFPTATRSLI